MKPKNGENCFRRRLQWGPGGAGGGGRGEGGLLAVCVALRWLRASILYTFLLSTPAPFPSPSSSSSHYNRWNDRFLDSRRSLVHTWYIDTKYTDILRVCFQVRGIAGFMIKCLPLRRLAHKLNLDPSSIPYLLSTAYARRLEGPRPQLSIISSRWVFCSSCAPSQRR